MTPENHLQSLCLLDSKLCLWVNGMRERGPTFRLDLEPDKEIMNQPGVTSAACNAAFGWRSANSAVATQLSVRVIYSAEIHETTFQPDYTAATS